MSSPDEDEFFPPAAPTPLAPRPSFLQPSRRSRLGRGGRQGQERRIPGVPPAPGEEAEELPAVPFPEEYAPEVSEPVAGEGDPEEVTESRTVAYRPPSRSTETLWAGEQSGPVPTYAPPGGRSRAWRMPALLFLLGLGLGGGVGFWARGGGPASRGVNSATAAGQGLTAPPNPGPDADAPLSPFAELPANTLAAVVTDLDNAFGALRAGKFADADASLRSAQDRRPAPPGTRLNGASAGWPEVEVERARVRFYSGDLKGADRALDTVLRAPGTASARADALLLRALIQGALRAPAQAEDYFAAAASANPARADTFFFWGNALRTEGKPAESIPKFQAALLRNQFETMDGLIRLKLWTSQLQVDAQARDAVSAIEAATAPPNAPTGYTWMGVAARAIREGRFAEAGQALGKGRGLLEPVIYRVAVNDPFFAEQSWRPELAAAFR